MQKPVYICHSEFWVQSIKTDRLDLIFSLSSGEGYIFFTLLLFVYAAMYAMVQHCCDGASSKKITLTRPSYITVSFPVSFFIDF